jgi:hypothetical protein
MFRASSAHLQEVTDVNCICMQPLVSSISAGGRLVQSLKGDWYVEQLAQRTSLPLAQDGHLQRWTIPVAAYIYSLHH